MQDYIGHTGEDAAYMHACSSVQNGLERGVYRPLDGHFGASETTRP